MKIAVSCNGTDIWAHFGHCENFMVFNTADGAIQTSESIPNPGHRPGFLPNFLADMGVEVIISGGMGGGAVDIFNERNVEVVLGAQGDAKTAVEAYLQGNLQSTGSICHHHEHADSCGEHH
ncbi:NifB/NifX family molybdenum-iron cluster-binding protein [Bengtsoniella intestinalis]|uniref:NifB/NifX family molybdenum-iron cluster-binding protein n=1 Tax=Bengtsoniella intestinalis TaxID=3073143 RepID=UPI00391FB28F